MDSSILKVEIRSQHDVVQARQRARQVAEVLGLERQDQARVATAVSELARNALQYAGSGQVEFVLGDGPRQCLEIHVTDHGKGIPHLQSILNGEYQSSTGTGLGIVSAKRLMDGFHIESEPSGTTITLQQYFPLGAPRIHPAHLGSIVRSLAQQTLHDPFLEIQRQNQELLATMAELQKRQEELSHLNRELEDTNRGVVALYAELDQRADHLRRLSESKTRFLSNMTHEFRTPLNSILSLARMMADRVDGELTAEQERQVEFIRRAAADLASLVDDLLDLSKVEAGKVSVRPEIFELHSLFNALRGTLRPLLANNVSVNLVFEPPENIPPLHTDEAKLSQVLRNFISNALKYTKEGEVRVSAHMDGREHVIIAVADTGLGIAPQDQQRVFDEFEQVEGPHQKVAKGTGLGLPLAKSLTELLGGQVRLESRVNAGSTFSVRIPLRHSSVEAPPVAETSSGLPTVLLVDDDEVSRYIVKSLLAEENLEIVEARGGREGLQMALVLHPDVILLDLTMSDLAGSEVLRNLKENPSTADIPVLINTSRDLTEQEKAELAGRSAAILSKSEKDPQAVRQKVRESLAGRQSRSHTSKTTE